MLYFNMCFSIALNSLFQAIMDSVLSWDHSMLSLKPPISYRILRFTVISPQLLKTIAVKNAQPVKFTLSLWSIVSSSTARVSKAFQAQLSRSYLCLSHMKSSSKPLCLSNPSITCPSFHSCWKNNNIFMVREAWLICPILILSWCI